MSNNGGSVVLSADLIIELAEELEGTARKLRQAGLENFTTSRKPDLNIDLLQIDWIVGKFKDNKKADPNSPFCWAFARNRAGELLANTNALVMAIQERGVYEDAKYSVTLSEDGSFLTRKIRK